MVKISEISLPPPSSTVVTSSSCPQQQKKRARKSAEAAAEEEDDRISTLPDALILHILSLLTSTRDAIRTGVLSRRWLRLWTHVPNLFFLSSDIKSSNLSGYPQQDFAHFVNRALLSRSSSRIEKFLIKLWLHGFPSAQYSQINLWLHYATKGEVKELTLDLSDGKNNFYYPFQVSSYSLPQFFYSNDSLVELNIKLCDIVPRGKINWVNLKILRLKYSHLTDDVTENVLSGSPVLETLELSQCMGINHLNICSRSLKRLVMNQIYSSGNMVGNSRFFDISAPYVQYLEILGNWRQIILIDMPSLITCNLDFQLHVDYSGSFIPDQRHGNIVKELVEMVDHCKELKIGAWCLEALSKLEEKSRFSYRYLHHLPPQNL